MKLRYEKSILKKKKKDISILQKSMEDYLACTFHARQNSILVHLYPIKKKMLYRVAQKKNVTAYFPQYVDAITGISV